MDDLLAFKEWWHREGSGITPLPDDDMESHTERVACIAWLNGAYKATESKSNDG